MKTMNRAAFLRAGGGYLLAAVVAPAVVARPHCAHANTVHSDLEHPEPREGITSELVLSDEALGKFANRPKIAKAYASARANPGIFDGIACACSCGGSKKGEHRSLLTCYESMQATGCGACQEEAEIVVKMIDEGKSLADIRVAVNKWAD
jgi:hypothetical protein